MDSSSKKGKYSIELLLQYIKQGNKSKVLSFLQDVDPCQSTNNFGDTLLHIMAENGITWLVEYLINSGANVDAQNDAKETPLMLAVSYNQLEAVQVLLKANADIFLPNSLGHCALGKSFEKLVNEEKIVNLNVLTITRQVSTALLNQVTFESLSTSGHINSLVFQVNCPLYRFMLLKNADLTKLLIHKGSPVNAKHPLTGNTSLHIAVQELDLENVKILLKYNADVNLKNRSYRTPLASFNNFSDQDKVLAMFNILVAAGANLLDYKGRVIWVDELLLRGNKEVIRSILKCKIDLHFMDSRELAPLHYLAKNSNPDVLAELSYYKFNVNIRTPSFNETMLHYAAVYGNVTSIKFLLDRGAKINAETCKGYTPLGIILSQDFDKSENLGKYSKCIEILLSRGADPQVVKRDDMFHQLKKSKDSFVKMVGPIIAHLALVQISGQKMKENMQFMMAMFGQIIDAKKVELAELKELKLGKSITLLDFLTADDKKIPLYARYDRYGLSSFDEVKKYNLDPCYQRRLHELHLKFTKCVKSRQVTATVIDHIFIKFCNVSVYSVAEKIVEYLEDYELYKFLIALK